MKKHRNNYKVFLPILVIVAFWLSACNTNQKKSEPILHDDAWISTVHHPEWTQSANLYEVNVRQYTPEGTFNAFAEHLPRLKDMGVDILWFMPITPIGEINRKGTLGSYYSVQNYTAINPEFGSLEDFKNMVQQIHDLGMYVIIDWVANHTAWDHSWVKSDPDFYFKDEDGNFTPPHNTDWSDVIQLDYENKELWNAMINEMKFWVDEINIDGFRCDVAYLVPTEFWNQARAELQEIKPVFMLAEADHPELMEHAFNAGYSWTSHHAMNRIAKGEDDVSALDKYYFEDNMGNYPIGAFKISFIDNHDENSWAGSVFDRLGEGMQAFAVLVNTVPGMPLTYNGQEAGLDKSLDFFEKDQIDWSNLKYEEFFTSLANLKNDNQALWNGLAGGTMQRVNTNDDKSVFAFLRQKGTNKVLVILNLSSESKTVTFEIGTDFTGRYTDFFKEERIRIRKNSSIEMPPWGYKVYVK